MDRTATISSIWAEADPLSIWRYDWPDRRMAFWEMPVYRVLIVARRAAMRLGVLWHLLTTGPNTSEDAPWDAGGWRRVKAVLALLLPVPVRWHYPHYGHNADSVLIWWSSGIASTPNGLSWRARYVAVGWGWNWRAYIYEDGE